LREAQRDLTRRGRAHAAGADGGLGERAQRRLAVEVEDGPRAHELGAEGLRAHRPERVLGDALLAQRDVDGPQGGVDALARDKAGHEQVPFVDERALLVFGERHGTSREA
jgi:hypothetical protein